MSYFPGAKNFQINGANFSAHTGSDHSTTVNNYGDTVRNLQVRRAPMSNHGGFPAEDASRGQFQTSSPIRPPGQPQSDVLSEINSKLRDANPQTMELVQQLLGIAPQVHSASSHPLDSSIPTANAPLSSQSQHHRTTALAHAPSDSTRRNPGPPPSNIGTKPPPAGPSPITSAPITASPSGDRQSPQLVMLEMQINQPHRPSSISSTCPSSSGTSDSSHHAGWVPILASDKNTPQLTILPPIIPGGNVTPALSSSTGVPPSYDEGLAASSSPVSLSPLPHGISSDISGPSEDQKARKKGFIVRLKLWWKRQVT